MELLRPPADLSAEIGQDDTSGVAETIADRICVRHCRGAPEVRGNSAIQLGFSLVDQTKIVTAASELARNTLEHGGGGRVVSRS